MSGDVTLSPTQIKEWFKRVKNGRDSLEREPRSGRPCASQNEKVKDEVFFYSRGIVDHKYAPEDQTINKKYYLVFLR